MEHYWPITPNNCFNLKFAVEWGNNNTDKAQVIGRQEGEYMMKNLEMKYVYDYMLYVLQGCGKLMKLDATVPENATEVCSETMACPITDGGLIRQCMDDSLVMSLSLLVVCGSLMQMMSSRGFLRNKKVRRERSRSGPMSIGRSKAKIIQQ
ncbi:hypothetical protein Bca4012_064474 [Brassica carinata]|uniref:Glycosyl transferase CAP10 domain-containing protein n=1 Tax=Brassica carinata TaxID=52824 RepID=A0A8X7VM47_BRACI|nr:hypothetical protein Bca52824_016957 [Brassica carinata]